MKVARLAALALAVALTLLALSGARDRAAAQATADAPSGSGRMVQVTDTPETGPMAAFGPALRLANLLAGRGTPLGSGFSAWLSAPRSAAASSDRSVESSGERRSLDGPLSRRWARSAGR
jgi:hypothetical protein